MLARRRVRNVTLLDRVYEHITLPPLIMAAVDTPQFQRLRSLHQLGASSFLYPGAVHTRFEHSIGVAHMARVLLQNFQHNQPELGITESDVHMAMLAGLLHDVGHGPFSHLFEDVVVRRCQMPTFSHEAMSQRIARRVLQPLLAEKEVELVLRLMAGAAPSSLCYGEIISNKRNGIDVDRMDYFIRDSMCCFGKPTVDVRVNRLFHSARLVVGGEDGRWQMAFEQKLALALREFFTLRAKLHKNVYQHQVTKAIGHMLGDILALALPYFKLGQHTLLECTEDDRLFLRLGDWILEAIESSDTPALQPARDLIARLRCRDIYHTVFASALDPHHGALCAEKSECAPKAVDWHAAILAHAAPQQPLQAEDFIADVVVINHGKGAADPLASVLFFNPKRPTQSPMRLNTHASNNNGSASRAHDGGSLFTPLVFEEQTLMVFERHNTNGAVARACERLAADDALRPYFVDSLPFYNPK